MVNDLPEQFADFSEARRAGFLRVKQLKEDGKRVAGVFCTFTPQEILDAAGFIPVSLCGMSNETIPDAEAHLPKNMCPLIKSSYGFAVSDKCPYTYFSDLIVGESTCDGKKKMYEMLNDIRPTYMLHLPQGLDGDALYAWTKEFHRFIGFLEEKFAIKITDEALREAARVRNKEREARMKLMLLQKQHPPLVSGMQMYSTLEGAGFLFDSAQRLARMNDLHDSLVAAAEQGECPIPADTKRILVTGCPIGGVLQKTVGAIEEKGGTVVCFENCSGIKAAFQMVDTEADSIVEALAARYLEIGCSVISPNPKRMELLTRLVKEFAIDGIVEIDLQACTPYMVETHTVRRQAEAMGIPYLAIETDYSQSDSGQLSTRIEAFLEMI